VHVWTSVFSYVFFLFGAGLWMLGPQDEPAHTTPIRKPDFPMSRNLKPVYSRKPPVLEV